MKERTTSPAAAPSIGWTAIDPEEVPPRRTARGTWVTIVESFAESGEKAARLALNGASAKTARVSLSTACIRLGLPVAVVKRGDDVYLVRTDL